MLTRKKEKALVTRQTILDTAEEVFFETGYSGATLEKIAQRCELTRGAIYWHFANKTEVLEAVIERTGLFYRETIDQLAQQASSLDELEEFTVKLLRDIARDKRKQRSLSIVLLRHEHLASESSFAAKAGETREYIEKVLTHLFLRLPRETKTVLTTKEARLQAQAFLFYIHGILLSFLVNPEKTPLASQAAGYLRFLFNTFRVPLRHAERSELTT